MELLNRRIPTPHVIAVFLYSASISEGTNEDFFANCLRYQPMKWGNLCLDGWVIDRNWRYVKKGISSRITLPPIIMEVEK